MILSGCQVLLLLRFLVLAIGLAFAQENLLPPLQGLSTFASLWPSDWDSSIRRTLKFPANCLPSPHECSISFISSSVGVQASSSPSQQCRRIAFQHQSGLASLFLNFFVYLFILLCHHLLPFGSTTLVAGVGPNLNLLQL